MSLAEELLADLEDEEEVEEEAVQARDEECETEADHEAMDVSDGRTSAASDLKEVVRLYDSASLRSVLDRMKDFSSQGRGAKDLSGPVEADPEYLLIVEANNLVTEIDEEIAAIYKFAKDKYNKRFPELETLVVQPLEFLLAAKELGNNVLRAKNNEVLEQFLTQATIMVVSVTASTTQGFVQQSKKTSCPLNLS